MKYYYTLLLASFMISLGNAQVAKNDQEAQNSSQTEESVLIKKATDKAILAELNGRLKETLKLPSIVQEFNITGKSLVNVHIDATGKITKTEIIKSLGKSVDKSIHKAFSKINEINTVAFTKDSEMTVVQVPVVVED